MKPSPDIRAKLIHIGALPDGHLDLTETALTLASIEHSGVPIEPYRRHLQRLASDVGVYAGSGDHGQGGIERRQQALRQIVAKRYGYGAADDAYEDPDNANFMRVVDRRRGLPVVLGILYLHVARTLGWSMSGLDFPARFLVRLQHESRRVVIDPFDGGRVISPEGMRELIKAVSGNHAELTPGLYAEISNRDILLRAQGNIKSRLLRAERLEEALEVIKTMLLFAPQAAALWREAGLLYTRLDNIKAAVSALEEYMRYNTGDSTRYRTSILLQELRERLN